MGFGLELREKLLKELKDEKLVSFCERITDDTLNRNISFSILDFIADEDYNSLGNLLEAEMSHDCFVLDVSMREYPNLFNRRIYVPACVSLLEMVFCVLASLRITDYEKFYITSDGKRYDMSSITSISMFDFRNMGEVSLYYGSDLWCFDISLIGVSKKKDDEISMPYVVIDGVGYGIAGRRKSRLIDSFLDSIDHSTDTKNPLMDDEEFEFYNADTDSLNENATEDYELVRKSYLGDLK